MRYAHASFTVDATWLVPLNEPGRPRAARRRRRREPLHGGREVPARPEADVAGRARRPVQLLGRRPEGVRDRRSAAASTRRSIGSPFGARRRPSSRPTTCRTRRRSSPSRITPETAARGLVPIVIAASVEGLDAARRRPTRRCSASSEALYRESAAHYRRLREEMTSIDTPGRPPRSRVRVGQGRARQGLRLQPAPRVRPHRGPRAVGHERAAGVRLVLRRRRVHQLVGDDGVRRLRHGEAVARVPAQAPARRRQDDARAVAGRRVHPAGSRSIPYGYYHADTTPLYIIAVRDYVRASGDVALAKDFWPSMRKAYDYCASTDEDGDGLMDNTKAGPGRGGDRDAAAARRPDGRLPGRRRGPRPPAPRPSWRESRATRFARDGASRGREGARVAERAASSTTRAGASTSPWMKDGKGQAEPTVWPGVRPLARRVRRRRGPAVAGALDDLAGAGVGADWGARMLSIDSALYEPLSYNNGASWPFLTGFAALGALRERRGPDAAWPYLDGTADLTFLESRGYMAELFSGDRLRSIDAAVPHQLFATTGFMSTLMRGLVGPQRAAGGHARRPGGARTSPARAAAARRLGLAQDPQPAVARRDGRRRHHPRRQRPVGGSLAARGHPARRVARDPAAGIAPADT